MQGDHDQDPGDRDAFRQAMRDVRPRRPSPRDLPARTPPAPRPLSREADERAVMAELLTHPLNEDTGDGGETLAYRGPGVQETVFRRLRRGAYRIGAELDLHGLTAISAREALDRFLGDCRARDIRCVRVIHGKGLRSAHGGPVLKARVDGWLRRRRDVLAFVSARPRDGGSGAVYVLLRRG